MLVLCQQVISAKYWVLTMTMNLNTNIFSKTYNYKKVHRTNIELNLMTT